MEITGRRSRRAGGPDRGSTLVEVLVSVALLGTTGVAVLTALSTVILASTTHREIADGQARLTTAADALSTTNAEWHSCLDTADLPDAYQTSLASSVPSGTDIDVVTVEFWNGVDFGTACAESSGHRMQRITLQMTAGDRVRRLAIVTRPPASLIPTSGTAPLPTTTAAPTTTAPTTTSTTTTSTTTTSTTTPGTTAPATSTTSTSTSTTTSTTVPPTTTTTTQPGFVSCSFVVYEAWGSGGNAWLTITNSTKTSIKGWRVEITRNGSKISLWNAKQSTSSTTVRGDNLSWNGSVGAYSAAIPTGGSVSGKKIGVNQSFPCTVRSTS